MRKIREVLRLSWGGKLGARAVAHSCGLGRTTVQEYLQRARQAGLSWPLPDGLSDSALEALLFAPPALAIEAPRPVPDWSKVQEELRRQGVTLVLLWEEYKQTQPEGYEYSRFCELYRHWRQTLPVYMHQDHQAGEKLFVDYAGQTMTVVDRETGAAREAQIFVAVLGTSNYTYAEATWTQSLPDLIASHTRALAFFGGVPAIIVPDNLRSAVSASCRYEPEINLSYQQWAEHYGCAIIPARVRKPQDKAKVEKGVQDVERRVLAPLRHRTFFSLAELNQAIASLLAQHNRRPFQQREGSRRSLFEALDQPALRPLPATRYEYAHWLKARVNLSYHVAVEHHHYSVPYTLVKQEVQIRLTAATVEIFHDGLRIASHPRSPRKYQYTTQKEHMPRNHQAQAEWPPERIIHWVGQAGAAT
ncbi:MAG: IS21 family transposase, partial [Candidatus Hydrogenedentes bacterium]|nr:IS21 family transposase [Candidatus Hydrogenedentota bacterium]